MEIGITQSIPAKAKEESDVFVYLHSLSALDNKRTTVYYSNNSILAGLGRLGGERALKELLKREECIWVAFAHPMYINALAKLGDEDAFVELSKWVTAKKAKDREFAAIAMGYTELQRAEPWLLRLLSDQIASVQDLAAQNLSNIPYPSKIAISALTKVLRHKFRKVRVSAARSLGNIGPAAKTAIPALTEMLKDENTDNEFKNVIAEALKKIKRSTTTKPNLTTQPASRP